MTAEARAVRIEDVAELAELYREALSDLGTRRGGPRHRAGLLLDEPLEDSLRALACRPGRRILVGTYDGVLVGFASLVIAPGIEELASAVVVEALYVHPDARQVGVGNALLSAARAWARAERCSEIDASALPGDRATKAFFEAEGLRARLVLMNGTVERP